MIFKFYRLCHSNRWATEYYSNNTNDNKQTTTKQQTKQWSGDQLVTWVQRAATCVGGGRPSLAACEQQKESWEEQAAGTSERLNNSSPHIFLLSVLLSPHRQPSSDHPSFTPRNVLFHHPPFFQSEKQRKRWMKCEESWWRRRRGRGRGEVSSSSLLTHCPPLETAPPLWTVPLPVKPFFFFPSFPLRRRPSVWEKFALGQRCQTEECEAESDLKTEFS